MRHMSVEIEALKTRRTALLVVKLWFPLLILGGTWLSLRGTYAAAVTFGVPMVLWALFNFTACELWADERDVRYRRFFKWRAIPYSDILRCEVSWRILPMGSLKLRRPVPPWGKIYFVLPGSGFECAWPGGQTKFTAWVNAKVRGEPVQLPVEKFEAPEVLRTGQKRCAALAVFGFVYSFCYYLVSEPVQQRSWEGFPPAIRLLIHLEQLALTWPWGLVTSGLMAVVIFRERFEGRAAWLASFFGGALLSSVLIRWLNVKFGP